MASVKDLNKATEIGLYPNAWRQLTVTVNAAVSSIGIYAIDGTCIIYDEHIPIEKTVVKSFDCSNLANGVYIVAIKGMNGPQSTKKWIK